MLLTDSAPYPRRYRYLSLLLYTVQFPGARPWWHLGRCDSEYLTEEAMLTGYRGELRLAASTGTMEVK